MKTSEKVALIGSITGVSIAVLSVGWLVHWAVGLAALVFAIVTFPYDELD